jgi:hypothetical protein
MVEELGLVRELYGAQIYGAPIILHPRAKFRIHAKLYEYQNPQIRERKSELNP